MTRMLRRLSLPRTRIIDTTSDPPPETIGRLCVDVQIRRVADGVVREHVDNAGFRIQNVSAYLLDADDLIEAHELALLAAARSARYWWMDGNGGCDCNRSLFHHRAGIALGAKEDPEYASTGGVCRGRDGYELVAPAWLTSEDWP